MERLQSGFLIKPYYLNKISTINSFKDEYYLDYPDFVNKFPNIANNNLYNKLLKNNKDYRYYSYFHDIFNDTKVILPIKIINLITHSNGLYSGNSKEEALVQGISEIFERHCYKEILLAEKNIPTIPEKELINLDIYKHLLELYSFGLSFEIKDCSLNGKYPVVGIIIYDNSKEHYLFSIGSDPDFNIALQRSLTEIFQGLTYEEIMNKMKPVHNDYHKLKKEFGNKFFNENWLKCYTANNGIHPIQLFTPSKTVHLNDLPFSSFKDNKLALQYVYNIIKANNLKIYVKDYSFFDFCTYKVYISPISIIDDLDEIDTELYSNLTLLKEFYYNPFIISKNITSEHSKIIKNLLNKLNYDPKYSNFISPYSAFNVNNFITSDYTQLNYFYILLIIYSIDKDFKSIIKLVDYRLHNVNISDYEIEFLSALQEFLLLGNFTTTCNNKVIKDNISSLILTPLTYIKSLQAPSCPNCKKCLCKSTCHYKE